MKHQKSASFLLAMHAINPGYISQGRRGEREGSKGCSRKSEDSGECSLKKTWGKPFFEGETIGYVDISAGWIG